MELERLGRIIGQPEGGDRRLHEASRGLGNGMEYFMQMERRGNALIQRSLSVPELCENPIYVS
jgi:hypothetical protein